MVDRQPGRKRQRKDAVSPLLINVCAPSGSDGCTSSDTAQAATPQALVGFLMA